MERSNCGEVPVNFTKVKPSKSLEKLKKPPSNVGTWWSSRFCLAYLAFFGFANVFALRVNLSVAIVSMVNSSYQVPKHQVNHSDVCSDNSNQVNHTVGETGEFNWNGNQRGLVLGAFFYGYILMQIPGGYLANRFGGKYLLGGGILGTSILTLLTPLAARTSFTLLIVVRVLEGIIEGPTFPAMHAMWGSWAPPIERSRLVALSYAGCQFGIVVAQPIAGLLCSSTFMGGWPSVFYIYGIVGVVWCLIWFLLAKNYPRESKTISVAELQYIEANVKPISRALPVPWMEIACSKAVWGLSIAYFCNNWGSYTLLTCLPLYLSDVLRYDIAQDGFISALPYLVVWFCVNIAAYMGDYLRGKGTLTTTQTRKVFNSIAFIGPAIFLVVAGYVGCNKAAAVAFICLSTAFNGCIAAGISANHIDIASRYAGVLMGITNAWGTIPGFLSPLVVGAFTNENPSHHNWMFVFYITAALYVVGTIAYSLMGTGVEQDWNKDCFKSVSEEKKPLLSHYVTEEENENMFAT